MGATFFIIAVFLTQKNHTSQNNFPETSDKSQNTSAINFIKPTIFNGFKFFALACNFYLSPAKPIPSMSQKTKEELHSRSIQ
jgi:hypothetical protein